MNYQLRVHSFRRARPCVIAAQISFSLAFLLATTAQAQIAIQDGNALAITPTGSANISQSFTVTPGAGVMVILLEDYGARLNEPATLAWNGQTLTRDVQTAYNDGNQRSMAIYHLFNPPAGTANINGTDTNAMETWVTAYTLKGVNTAIAPWIGSTNTGTVGTGVNSLSISDPGAASGAWAVVNAMFANAAGLVSYSGTSGTGASVNDTNQENSDVSAGFVSNLSAGAATLTATYTDTPGSGNGGQKADFAAVVFTPTNVAVAPVGISQSFGIKFLGNTTDAVTGTAGVVPISGWNNIANGTYTVGTIYSSDGTVAATLIRSGPGAENTWNSGAFSDGGNNSLMDGYQDAGQNGGPATNVISGLTGAAYDVYLYTGGDVARPSSATDYLPNYTINGTTYYTATLDGYDAILQIVQSVPTSQNSSTYPTTLTPGQYLKISSVVPVNGAITITASSDPLTYRSPLNGIEVVPIGNAPEIMSQPLSHRLYTGGAVQLQVQAECANPMFYQWCQNGTNLSDGSNISGSQTTNLIITNLALANSGNYTVVITNSYGSVTSSVANLNVVVETTADAAFEDWVAAYVVTTNYQTAVFYSLQTRHANNTLWQQAYQIWMVNDVYDCTHSPDQQRLINALINTFIHTQGTNFTSDSWDDDIEWGDLGLIRSYESTGNILALNAAIFNWNAVYSRGWNDVFGGGILEQIGYGSKDALSNYPEIIGGMHLYQITGQTNYLTTCETIYNWAYTNLFIATPAEATNGMNLGQVNEGVDYATTNQTGEKVLVSDNSYNSGLFAMSATLFYETTGNTQYLSDAILAANQKINQEPILNESTFGEEILVRGAAMIASQNNYKLWPTYGPWLLNNAAAAWNERRTDYNLTWDDFTSPTPGTTNNLDAIDAECAVLVQQMAQSWIPGYATNFTLNYGGTPISESAGNDWNNGNIWNPYGLSAATAASGYPGSSFEVVVGSLVRNPAGSTDNAFPGDTLQIDGNGNTDFNSSPVGVGEIRFKNSTPGIPSTNYFNNLILNGGELNIGDPTDVILQGQIAVQTNSVFGTQGGTGTNQAYEVDSYLTGSGTILLYLTNSTPSASLDITGTTNTFTGQWNILQGPLVGGGINSLGTNTITIGAGGILETTYPINNTNASLVLNGRMFLTQTDAFNSVIINGTPLPAGVYTAAQLNSTDPTAFPLSFIALYGTTATSASGAIEVGNVVVSPSSPQITSIQVSGAGGLTLSATNGTPGGSWTLLQSTNVALPLSQWQINTAGNFDASGDLLISLPGIATNSQEFYIFKVQ